MELCEADMAKLERKGYQRNDFSTSDGKSVRLSNVDGFCFFYDRTSKRCKEYPSRPIGCSIYPVILSDSNEIVIDDLCPDGDTLNEKEILERAIRLRSLIETIDREAAKRNRSA